MKVSMEDMYKEMYVDMVLVAALNKRNAFASQISADEKAYLEDVIKIHSHVSYAVMCLAVQCRASLKAKLNVEKQYVIRRTVVTSHEMYKYLYGFSGRCTPWLKLEQALLHTYPDICKEIDDAAVNFKNLYALDTDGDLRDVAKHFSDDPTEFFRNMERVDEKNTTERMAAALAFLQPMHSMLTKELNKKFGNDYTKALVAPMPVQKFEPVGSDGDVKVDALTEGIVKYSGIINHLMLMVTKAHDIGLQYNLDVDNSEQWKGFTDNNIGLHILYIFLDMMTTFKAFLCSETFAEYRQNLAYLIVSAHEGFKKLYGFDQNKRYNCYWNRAIKKTVMQTGDEKLTAEMNRIEEMLNKLSESPLLCDEDMVVAYTHVGYIKKYKNESTFAVLDYFSQPVNQAEMECLTNFLKVMNDVVKLYTDVLEVENEQMNRATKAKFDELYCMIDKLAAMGDSTKDPNQSEKWSETTRKMREMLDKLVEKI